LLSTRLLLGLKKAAELPRGYPPVLLQADAVIGCWQRQLNQECIGMDCPVLQEQATGKKTGNALNIKMFDQGAAS